MRSRSGPQRSRIVDRFRDEAGRCTSDEHLRSLLEEVTRELGFRYFALLHHSSLSGRASGTIRIDNYPGAWARELIARKLAGSDPVHQASLRANSGFAWDELGSLLHLDGLKRRILERAAYHGIGTGFTIPANVPGEPSGSCSFAMRRGRDLPAARLLCAELIGAHAFRAAR